MTTINDQETETMNAAVSQLEILANEAERIRGELAVAQAKAEAENEAAEQRRAKAQAEFDRQTLAEFDEASLDQEVDEATRALTEAVKADPLWQAVIRLNKAQQVRANEMGRVQRRSVEAWCRVVAVTDPECLAGPVRRVVGIAGLEAAAQAADIADAHDQARVAVGEKAARRRK